MSGEGTRMHWSATGVPLKAGCLVVLVGALAFALASSSFAGNGDGSRPTITGNPIVGETLTSSSAGDTGLYNWQRCDPNVNSCADGPFNDGDWVDIPGAKGHDKQSYTLTSADLGKFVRVNAKGTSLGEQWQSSEPVGPVQAGTPPPPPTITGNPVVGETLTASDGGPSATYQWQRCNPATATCVEDAAADDPNWTDIPGATGRDYTLTADDAGHLVRVLVNGNVAGSTFVPSTPVGPVATPAAPAQETAPAPQHGINLLAKPTSGPVGVKVPGSSGFTPLTDLTEIPFGSIFNINGRANCVELTAATGVFGSETPDQKLELCGTPFKTSQAPEENSDAVAKVLKAKCNGNGNGNSAGKSSGGPVATAARKRRRGRLWASGKGGYATQGVGGTGSVRGTTWLTKETCAGTFFKVSSEPGEHGLAIDAKNEANPILLGPGDSYFAAR